MGNNRDRQHKPYNNVINYYPWANTGDKMRPLLIKLALAGLFETYNQKELCNHDSFRFTPRNISAG